jgi:Meckel syndrome type 1 protein
VDARPSELDPYPRSERDLGSAVLWERSLTRSHRRRERARRARRNAPRQKGATLAAGAAILATPVAAPLAASAASSHPGVSKAEIATRAAAPHQTPTDLLSYGDTGEAVAAVQAQLRIVEDGIFGPQTEGAVKQFQIVHGLGATGIVDTRTWAELFRVQVKYFGESSASAHTAMASAGTQPAAQPTGGPDLSDRVELRDEVESPSPSTGSEPAPAPVQSTPVSTSGSGGCTSDGRIVTPVSNGTETSPYGDDRGDHIHSGEDIAAPTGTTVRAADCGTVSISGTESGYGEMVCIQHAGGTTTCYAHLSQRDVAVNDYVKAGQKIGEVGCTGNCTGPHVHFEVRVNGKATDPAPYLAGSKTVQGQTTTATQSPLPAGEGGTGGPSAADEAALFGEATGGTTATPASTQPAATGAQPTAETTAQAGAETAPAETTPQPAETAPAQPAPETAPAQTAPQPAEAAPAQTAPETAPETAPAQTTPQPTAEATVQAGAETGPAATAPAAPAPAPAPAAPAPTAEPAPAAPADQAPAPTAEPSAPATQAAPAPAADASATAAVNAPAPAAPAQDTTATADAATTGGTAAPAPAGQ